MLVFVKKDLMFIGSCVLFLTSALAGAFGQTQLGGLPQYITQSANGAGFQIEAGGQAAPIVVDPQDWKGVLRATADLGDDVRKVTGTA